MGTNSLTKILIDNERYIGYIKIRKEINNYERIRNLIQCLKRSFNRSLEGLAFLSYKPTLSGARLYKAPPVYEVILLWIEDGIEKAKSFDHVLKMLMTAFLIRMLDQY